MGAAAGSGMIAAPVATMALAGATSPLQIVKFALAASIRVQAGHPAIHSYPHPDSRCRRGPSCAVQERALESAPAANDNSSFVVTRMGDDEDVQWGFVQTHGSCSSEALSAGFDLKLQISRF